MQFSDVIGHNELKKRLIDEVNQNRISHAQLYLGKMGHGGLAMALAFVQYLFCKDKRSDDSCGVCDNCRRVPRHSIRIFILRFQSFRPLESYPIILSVRGVNNSLKTPILTLTIG